MEYCRVSIVWGWFSMMSLLELPRFVDGFRFEGFSGWLVGDWYPRVECRRVGLKKPYMKSKTAVRVSWRVW